jgi:hypothetical protein
LRQLQELQVGRIWLSCWGWTGRIYRRLGAGGFVLDAAKDDFWLHERQKIRSDSLGGNVKATMEQWWADETTVFPNRKDIVNFHEGLRQWVSHLTHFFQCSQVGRKSLFVFLL